MRIVLTVTDPNILEDYTDTHPEIIMADFIANPGAWISCADVDVQLNDGWTPGAIPPVPGEYIITERDRGVYAAVWDNNKWVYYNTQTECFPVMAWMPLPIAWKEDIKQ